MFISICKKKKKTKKKKQKSKVALKIQCPPVKDKGYWESVVWVEPVTTSKLLALPHSHIKEKPAVKAYWLRENTA